MSLTELTRISFEGIQIAVVSIDEPRVVRVDSIDYSDGVGFGRIKVKVDGEAAADRFDEARTFNNPKIL